MGGWCGGWAGWVEGMTLGKARGCSWPCAADLGDMQCTLCHLAGPALPCRKPPPAVLLHNLKPDGPTVTCALREHSRCGLFGGGNVGEQRLVCLVVLPLLPPSLHCGFSPGAAQF